jgi:hypothetical protein
VVWAKIVVKRRKLGIDACFTVVKGQDTEICRGGVTAVRFFVEVTV